MIKIKFSVRPGQGEPSGFDLGDIVFEGESGTVGSAGHTPDQGMMIYLSVPLLLDGLRTLITGERRTVSFTGADTSFRLDFRCDSKRFVSVSANGRLEDLAHTVLCQAQSLAQRDLSRLPTEDPVRTDYLSALQAFRATA